MNTAETMTARELAKATGYNINHIRMLSKRGVLPPGELTIEGFRLFPAWECIEILSSHKPGEHWTKGRERPGAKESNAKRRQDKAWAEVI